MVLLLQTCSPRARAAAAASAVDAAPSMPAAGSGVASGEVFCCSSAAPVCNSRTLPVRARYCRLQQHIALAELKRQATRRLRTTAPVLRGQILPQLPCHSLRVQWQPHCRHYSSQPLPPAAPARIHPRQLPNGKHVDVMGITVGS